MRGIVKSTNYNSRSAGERNSTKADAAGRDDGDNSDDDDDSYFWIYNHVPGIGLERWVNWDLDSLNISAKCTQLRENEAELGPTVFWS